MTAPPPPPTPPGWYPHPDSGERRYWDGSAWGPAASSLPPQPAPMPSPPEKRLGLSGKTMAIIGGGVIATVVAVILLATWIFGSKEPQKQIRECPPSTASTSTPPSSDFNPPGAIGQEVRDGKFAFVVTAIRACQGQPIKVSMKVTNTATEPETFSASEQVLLRKPSHATGQIPEGGWACTRCDGDGERLYINPGDSTATVVSFNINGEEPAIEAIELHDSIFSLGVKVYP
jgi:Protein of unknown function (DUF2510)